jgi:hypothetical protein
MSMKSLNLLLLAIGLTACAAPINSTNSTVKPPDPLVSPVTSPVISPPVDEPGRVYLADRKFSFMPPADFVPMPPEEVAKKYPGSNAPVQVFTNGDRTATIAITFTSQPLTLAQLPELQGLMSKHLEKTVPGLKWIRKELLAINGGSWLNMEATSQEKQSRLHSDMYFTSFQDRMIGVNFSAEADRFAAIKKSAFLKSRDSIQSSAF